MLFRFLGYPALRFISVLPFPVIYVLSDFIYLILYHLAKYRRKVVRENLILSFPGKDMADIIALEKKFYRHLADLILETLKGLSLSRKELMKRVVNKSQYLYDKANNDRQNVIVAMSHAGNWEWVCMAAQCYSKQKAQCIYKPLKDQNFEKMMFNMRSRFGTMPIPMEKTLRVMSSQKDITTVTAFMGDQNPSNGQNSYWTTFLNRETAFMWGTEKIAKKMGLPVWYMQVKKVKRGYYIAETRVLCQDSASTKEGEITELLARATETDIMEQPECWLWSHRRWKHHKPVSD